ncbi:MAG: serine/threonine protein phosphatase, partial [Myxococcota bacterium]|nr:serine/threonine protein phosphatase [Myxococcota bacterium]
MATDLQGNWGDYCAMKAIYAAEEAAGHAPTLLFCGDMVHGPSPELNAPGAWPPYLGTAYRDESAAILRDFIDYVTSARAFSLLGNHEHAHVGGPLVSKFHLDEAAVLDRALGADRAKITEFMSTWPLIAVAGCGLAFVHGSPAATMPSLEAWETVRYTGYQGLLPIDMLQHGEPFGTVLWARSATDREAEAFLSVALPKLG